MRGDGGVAGEGRVVGIPKFHSWGKCTMPLTNINSDGCPTLPLACELFIYLRRFFCGGGSLLAEVNENINLGYSQDQCYS